VVLTTTAVEIRFSASDARKLFVELPSTCVRGR